MCTVTYIPFQGIRYLTSNRDESPSRQSSGIISSHHPDQPTIYFPLDEESGGSWIALSDAGRAVCLLNGGFESFIPNPPYRMSRGKVVIETARADDAGRHISQFDFAGIAPFTMLIDEPDRFTELVWDGDQKHMRDLSMNDPQIWSSATLYSPEVRLWRRNLFIKWLDKQIDFDSESILQFHRIANGDETNGFVMNRNEIVKTLSITHISQNYDGSSMTHLRLDKEVREEIKIRNA